MAFRLRRRSQRTPNDEARAYDWPTPSVDGRRPLTAQTAMHIADVFACVRCLADAAASVPLHLYMRSLDGRQRITTGRNADLIERPAPATTQANLIGQAVAHLNLHGNAFVGKFRGPDQRVEQLALIHPECVQVALVDGEPQYTVTGPKGRSVHGTADIIHIKALSTDGLLGLSPIRECRVALRVADGAGRFYDTYLRHGARPAGILKTPRGTNESVVDTLREAFSYRHGGVDRMHKAVVTSADVDWVPVTATLGDLEFVEQRRLSTAEICRIFKVQPWMVGAPAGDRQTYANVEQQQLAFVTHSLRPWLVLIEQALTADPDLCRGPNVYAEFHLDALLRADTLTRAEVYTAALNPQTGWMTREEVRRAENLPAEHTPAPLAPSPAPAAPQLT